MVLDLLLVSGDPFFVVSVAGEIEIQLVFSHWVWVRWTRVYLYNTIMFILYNSRWCKFLLLSVLSVLLCLS
jgi:hypothetical protein